MTPKPVNDELHLYQPMEFGNVSIIGRHAAEELHAREKTFPGYGESLVTKEEPSVTDANMEGLEDSLPASDDLVIVSGTQADRSWQLTDAGASLQAAIEFSELTSSKSLVVVVVLAKCGRRIERDTSGSQSSDRIGSVQNVP
jgi:hypothetical protein